MAIAEIKINKDKTLKIDSSVGWIIKYREQFGRDILPELLPLISAGVELTLKTMEDAGQSQEITIQAIAKSINKEALDDIMLNMAMLESVTVINIVWALMANAAARTGETIESPEIWAQEMDNFPIDIILPKAIKMIIQSTVSTKNLKRLQNLLKKPKQSE